MNVPFAADVLGEYCTHFDEDRRTMMKYATHRDDRATTTDACMSAIDPYVVAPKERSDKVDPVVEAHGRRW